MSNEHIGGKYKHYKGNCYEVYCVATTKWEEQFVLYQQLYGEKKFWIRPFNMFFDEIDDNGIKVKRFSPTSTKRKDAHAQIQRLIDLLKQGELSITHSETNVPFCITNISSSRDFVYIHALQQTHATG